MMMVTPVILRPARNSEQRTWLYKSQNDSGHITLKHSRLEEQFQSLTEIFEAAYDEPLIISISLHDSVLDVMEAANPETRYAYIKNQTRSVIFPQIWDSEKRNPSSKVTHICSDASGAFLDGGRWAFVSTDDTIAYEFGSLPARTPVSRSEFTGFYHAVMAHKSSEKSLAFYTDSLDTVRFMEGEEVSNIARGHGDTQDVFTMREEILETLGDRDMGDRLKWVRGHKRHRLNILADAIAYMSWDWNRSEESRDNHMMGYYALTSFI